MKRLLILGGSDLQVSLIKLAKKLGHFVITCDYLPDNPGHKFADEYYNVSTTNKEAILNLAKQLNLDGISAYASDPAALTAAWVSEKLNLPTNSYEATKILSRKDLFRDFLKSYGFNTPKSCSFNNYIDALTFVKGTDFPCIMKPVDSSGSKGVFKIKKDEKDFEALFIKSQSFSRAGIVIIEEFLEKKGYQIGGDGFLVNGKLVFRCFGDIHFAQTNPYLPCAVSVPSQHKPAILTKVHDEIQRLMTALKMKCGGLNFDIIVTKDEKIFIIEIGPRNGGNMLPELIEYCTGVDMKLYAIKTALGEDCSTLKMMEEQGCYSHYVLHSQKTGFLKNIDVSDVLKKNLLFENRRVNIGDTVGIFENSSNRLGILLLKFESHREMEQKVYNMHNHYYFEVNEIW